MNLGKACHIYSASPGGPRGQGGKEADFLSNESNGIWCCTFHADLIDKNHGDGYSAETLFTWKHLAEARQKKLADHVPSPLGWVDCLEVTKFPGLKHLPCLRLSQKTLLWGKNGSGKTVAFQLAASISNSRHAERFTSKQSLDYGSEPAHPRISSRVVYSTVDTLSKEIVVDIRETYATRREAQTTYILPPGDIEIVYCSDSDLRRRQTEDDLDFVMRVLSLDKTAARAICASDSTGFTLGEIAIRQPMLAEKDGVQEHGRTKLNGEPYLEILTSVANGELPMWTLSTSELGELMLDLMIRKAREVSKQRLTLLLIDSLSRSFDEAKFRKLLRVLEEETFQVVIEIPGPAEALVLESVGDVAVHGDDGLPIIRKDRILSRWRLVTIPQSSGPL